VVHDRPVFALVVAIIAAARSALRTHADLAVENLALRQQLAVLQRRRPRPPLAWTNLLFWIALSRVWVSWRSALAIVKPDTVVRWHRTAFRRFWTWRSLQPQGRPPTNRDVRVLVRRRKGGIERLCSRFTAPLLWAQPPDAPEFMVYLTSCLADIGKTLRSSAVVTGLTVATREAARREPVRSPVRSAFNLRSRSPA
jgi:hypothetical protein